MILRRLRERFHCWRRGHLLEPDGVLARFGDLTIGHCSRCGCGLWFDPSMPPGVALVTTAKEAEREAVTMREINRRFSA